MRYVNCFIGFCRMFIYVRDGEDRFVIKVCDRKVFVVRGYFRME